MCVSLILHTSLSSHFTIIMSIIVTLTILDDFILSSCQVRRVLLSKQCCSTDWKCHHRYNFIGINGTKQLPSVISRFSSSHSWKNCFPDPIDRSHSMSTPQNDDSLPHSYIFPELAALTMQSASELTQLPNLITSSLKVLQEECHNGT